MADTINLDNAYYGRKWQILINLDSGVSIDITDSNFGDYALRSTFTVDRPGYKCIHYGDISLWNLNAATDNQIVAGAQGTVIINAGYVSGAYGKIFEGKIFQVIRDRENATDYKVTIHCIDGHGIMSNNLTAFTMAAGLTYQNAVKYISSNAKTSITLGKITEDLYSNTLPRGKVFFGEPKKYLQQIASDNNAQFYVIDDAVHITKVSDSTSNTVTVSPSTGLIGYPTQIDYGITCTVLLNPNLTIVNPAMTIKLDQSVIRQQLINIGSVPTMLEKDGEYKVARIIHRGDTRGNEWYTDVTGVIPAGMIPYNLANPN